MLTEFRDRVAVVTGAASGIGRGIARGCAREGMRLVLADVDEDGLTAVGRELERGGARVALVRTDVRDAAQVKALAEATLERFGAVHLVVNNAGVMLGGYAWERTEDDWRWVLDVNLFGVIHGLRIFLPILLERGEPAHVVNTASVGGLTVGPLLAPYIVSKHAVVALTESTYYELATLDTPVGISVLCPGAVATRIAESARVRPKDRPRTRPLESPAERFFEKAIATGIANGLDPDSIGDVLFSALRQDRFWIYTHGDVFAEAIERRTRSIVEGTNPVHDAALEPAADAGTQGKEKAKEKEEEDQKEKEEERAKPSEPAAKPTRVYRNHHLDSTRWELYAPRAGDLIVTTSYKSGTTWTQEILNWLVNGDRDPLPRLNEASPWVDARFMGPKEGLDERLAAIPDPRFLKSHLPLDGLPFYEEVNYLVVARDPRDVFMSLYNHYQSYTDLAFQLFNAPDVEGEPLPPCPDDPRTLFREWITRGFFEWESEGYPFWSNMHHTATYWPHRHRRNVMFLHYNDMKKDHEGAVRRIARFAGIEASDERIALAVEQTRLENARANAIALAEEHGDGDLIFRGGQASFYFKGTNERWRSVLTDEDLALYEAAKARVLPPECAAWLESGGPV